MCGIQHEVDLFILFEPAVFNRLDVYSISFQDRSSVKMSDEFWLFSIGLFTATKYETSKKVERGDCADSCKWGS